MTMLNGLGAEGWELITAEGLSEGFKRGLYFLEGIRDSGYIVVV